MIHLPSFWMKDIQSVDYGICQNHFGKHKRWAQLHFYHWSLIWCLTAFGHHSPHKLAMQPRAAFVNSWQFSHWSLENTESQPWRHWYSKSVQTFPGISISFLCSKLEVIINPPLLRCILTTVMAQSLFTIFCISTARLWSTKIITYMLSHNVFLTSTGLLFKMLSMSCEGLRLPRQGLCHTVSSDLIENPALSIQSDKLWSRNP